MRSRAGSSSHFSTSSLRSPSSGLHESEDVGFLFVPGSAAIAYDLSVLVRATDDEGAILFGPYPGGAAAVLLARAPVIGAGAVVA